LRVDVRVVAATNRDLQAEVNAGRFRADLYFRLNVFPIVLPPLRERREDVPVLLRHFAAGTARRLGRAIDGIAPAFIAQAAAYDWPGNVRELENLVERALIMSRAGMLQADGLFPAAGRRRDGCRAHCRSHARRGRTRAHPARAGRRGLENRRRQRRGLRASGYNRALCADACASSASARRGDLACRRPPPNTVVPLHLTGSKDPGFGATA
jgi:transcriptional regulator with GAF, ATPase, and Fis domain